MDCLKANVIYFYSYTAKHQKKTKKIALKVFPNIDTTEMKEELLQKGINVKQCTKLKSKNKFSFSYLVTTTNDKNLKNVKNITNIGYTKAKWETYKRIKQYTQCFRCQRFGRGAMNCTLQPRSVKCGAGHPTHNCKLKINTCIKNNLRKLRRRPPCKLQNYPPTLEISYKKN